MYLLWTVLNGLVLSGLVVAGGYALRSSWPRGGGWALRGLGLGLCAWGSCSRQPVAARHPPSRQVAVITRADVPTRLAAPLEDHYLNALMLVTSYKAVPTRGRLASRVSFTGFQLGTAWHPQLVEVQRSGNLLTNDVQGTLAWRLLGVTRYRQPKHLRGTIRL